MTVFTGFISLRVGAIGRLFQMQKWTFQFRKEYIIPLLAGWQLSSQKSLFFMELAETII